MYANPDSEVFDTLVHIHVFLASLGFLCWLFVELWDPAEPSFFGRLLPGDKEKGFATKWTKEKYVSEHRKYIEGLDHFCSWCVFFVFGALLLRPSTLATHLRHLWILTRAFITPCFGRLNVAIGRSNYIPFFTLTCCGVLQYLVQAIVCLLMITVWHDGFVDRTSSKADPDGLVPAAGAFIVMLVSLGIGFPFTMLLLFHGTLLSTGQSTYSYIQNAQREHQRAQRAASEHAAILGGGAMGGADGNDMGGAVGVSPVDSRLESGGLGGAGMLDGNESVNEDIMNDDPHALLPGGLPNGHSNSSIDHYEMISSDGHGLGNRGAMSHSGAPRKVMGGRELFDMHSHSEDEHATPSPTPPLQPSSRIPGSTASPLLRGNIGDV